MSHSPPVPEASRSPFPVTAPKHDIPDLPPILRTAKAPPGKPALPVGTIGAIVGLAAVAVGGAIVGLRLWGEDSKSKPERRTRRKG